MHKYIITMGHGDQMHIITPEKILLLLFIIKYQLKLDSHETIKKANIHTTIPNTRNIVDKK
jgi:hypothetical protein